MEQVRGYKRWGGGELKCLVMKNFTKEDVQIVNEYLQRYLTSLAIREM